jgi:3-hydroxyacyl-CoA dehydrogenase/3a,7a,12a-trihydroxy-5b-cholest-24-enoyl-CoA hydratase
MRVFLERGEGKHLIQKVNATYNFEITKAKNASVAKTWIIDLKSGNGSVTVGRLTSPDATFTMTDDDFELVCLGKLNPQNAFLTVKISKKNIVKLNFFFILLG